ncbi:MAG: CaiB/BaiF CoA transferase family protein [Candidatus Hodarchaeota archaeon]
MVQGIPLDNIRIIDMTYNLPGPFCTQILGDLGADIIKIEHKKGDTVRNYPPFIGGESLFYLFLNRNKRSFCIDITKNKGLDIFHNLIKTADVLIHNFLPRTADCLKVSYNSIKSLNPSLIYCSISGYGQKGSWQNVPGHDLNYLSQAGILDVTGPKEHPSPPGVQIADIGGGALPAVISILAALIEREKKGGKGQSFDISMTHQIFPWLTIAAQTYFSDQMTPKREEHFLSGYLPFYRTYQTKDEKYISFATLEIKFWHNFCKGLDRVDFLDKFLDFPHLERELPQIFQERNSEEWEDFFLANHIPGCKILTIPEALNKYNEALFELEHPTAGKIKLFSPVFGTRKHLLPPPLLGQHTREIMDEMGYDKNKVDEYFTDGIIFE